MSTHLMKLLVAGFIVSSTASIVLGQGVRSLWRLISRLMAIDHNSLADSNEAGSLRRACRSSSCHALNVEKRMVLKQYEVPHRRCLWPTCQGFY